MLTAPQAELDAIAADESVRVVVIGARGRSRPATTFAAMRAEPLARHYEALFAQCARMS
jgi:hypothetical protein